MNKLVVHHRYANGMAFDLSGYRNHGYPYYVTEATALDAPGFLYRTSDSRVIVNSSTSLNDLLAIRATVTFKLDPTGGLKRRYNLIEGHLSFALFVNADGSLQGTVLDTDNNWEGAVSSPNLIKTGRWHMAEIRHDGINECSISLDGVPVGISYVPHGPVRSVGSHGVAIGNWPETSGQYTFDGVIREVYLYKYDPTDAANGLMDPCCDSSRNALDDMAKQLRANGYTAEKARQQGMDLLKFGLSVAARARGKDPARSKMHAILSAKAWQPF